jgi:peptide maturation system protein (TIGR04066 family)
MKNAIIYPYNATLLPMIRHMGEFQNEYQISQVVSFPGGGLTRKDAGYVCNQPHVGVEVKDSVDMQTSWSTLLLDGTYLNREGIGSELIEDAVYNQKEILCFESDELNITSWRKELYQRFSLSVIKEEIGEDEIEEVGVVHENPISVILVGGLVEQADSLELVCLLTTILRQKGLKVEVITDKPMYRLLGFHDVSTLFSGRYSSLEIIERINKYTYVLQQKFAPDVIVVHAFDGMLRYSNIVPNGYGIKTYMACQAIPTDYCFCCVPLDMSSPEMIKTLSDDFAYRYGTQITGVHVSNMIIDSMRAMQDRKLSVSYVDMKFMCDYMMKHVKEGDIPVFNAIMQEEKLRKTKKNC